MPSIPEEVYIIHNDETRIISTSDESGNTLDLKVRNMSVVDSAKTAKVEEIFNRHKRGSYDYHTRSYAKLTAHKEKIKNTPKSGYKVIGLSSNYNGPSRFNVVNSDNLMFQVHEKIMIQIMRGPGVGAGGKLNGEFVWGNTRKGVSLIPVGSPAYKDIINAVKNKTGKIKTSKLKVGTVYKNGHDNLRVFLGRINTRRVKTSYWNSDKGKLQEIKNGFLWLDIYRNRKKKWEEITMDDLIKEHLSLWRLNITKTPSVYKKVHHFKNVPGIAELREKMISKENLAESAASWSKRDKIKYSEYVNMSDNKSRFTYPGYEDFFKDLIVSNVVDS